MRPNRDDGTLDSRSVYAAFSGVAAISLVDYGTTLMELHLPEHLEQVETQAVPSLWEWSLIAVPETVSVVTLLSLASVLMSKACHRADVYPWVDRQADACPRVDHQVDACRCSPALHTLSAKKDRFQASSRRAWNETHPYLCLLVYRLRLVQA